MKRILLYAILFCVLFSCKSKQEIVQPIVVEKPLAFPLEALNRCVDSLLQEGSDSLLLHLYQYNDNKLLWTNDFSVQKALKWIAEARYHGLNSSKYKPDSLLAEWNLQSWHDTDFVQKRVAFDYALTKAVYAFGSDIRYGKLSPKSYHSTWDYASPKQFSDSTWIHLIQQDSINALNSFFSPQHSLYLRLYEALRAKLDSGEDGRVEIIDPRFLIRLGDSNKYVLPIKECLLPLDTVPFSMSFDSVLHQAVICFQKQHGLKPDGVVGPNTYYFLNWDKRKYIEHLYINQEKLRWLPKQQLKRGLVVNIPSMTLELYNHDTLFSARRVIVGRYKNQTPVFHSRLSYIVFNPCWTVPYSIASKSMLRGLQKDSAYLQKRNMFLTQGGLEVNADSVDFSLYNSTNFPFTILQRTDANNALGQVKFMFHNRYSIYLHDTPSKRLFKKDIRAYSHGCVRVDHATQMAEEILHDIDGQKTLHEYYYKKGFPVKVHLKNPIPLNLVYFTCWYDPVLNQLVYYKDIYGKDYRISKDLGIEELLN